jgi:hypothetical protein
MKLEKNEFDVNETITISVDIKNEGKYDGTDVLQLYIARENQPYMHDNKPVKQLKAFQRIILQRGETKHAIFSVPVKEINFWNYPQKCFVVENGDYIITLARSSATDDVIHTDKIKISGAWNRQLKHIVVRSSKCVLRIHDEATLRVITILDDYSRAENADVKIQYKSLNEQVVKVSEYGKVTALLKGTAVITASVVYNRAKVKESIAVAVI